MNIKLYQIRKTEPVARQTVSEIVWQGHSLLEAVNRVADKRNFEAQKASKLDYYSVHEVTPADMEQLFTVADGDKVDINFIVNATPYRAYGLPWSDNDLDHLGQDFTDAFYRHALEVAEEDID